MTHSELVTVASKWMTSKFPLVITEMVSDAGEIPDVIGFNPQSSTLIECKASRSDFLADAHKIYRRLPEIALGDYRYYCAIKGLIAVEELPPGWGLLEYHEGRLRTKIKAEYQKRNNHKEMALLISCIRRIGSYPIKGIGVRYYTIENKNKASVGIERDEVYEDGLGI